VCDDGSVDKTSDMARAAGASVIRHEKRLGKRASTSDLVNEVFIKSPSCLVLIEGEGFDEMGQLPAVLEPVLKEGADIAVAVGGSGGTLDAGITAMNSIGLSMLYRGGFFSQEGGSPQAAIAAMAGLRVRAVSLKTGETAELKGREKVLPPVERKADERRPRRRTMFDRDFYLLGVPSLCLTGLGVLLLADSLISYSSQGSLSATTAILGVAGMSSLIAGMFFMVTYYITFAANRAFARRES
ncbi:MAG TPA: hypothetical protein VMS77_07895, partial [Conexivisphaerales archaeon]|nr:hypothetical protein [Conexivisphaerales archaeon]